MSRGVGVNTLVPGPLKIHTWDSVYGCKGPLLMAGSSAAPGVVTWTANSAVYMPIWIPVKYTIRRFFVCCGSTVTGNYQVGLYDRNYNCIARTASTIGTGNASTLMYMVPTDGNVTVPLGSYYLAAWTSGSTSAMLGVLVSTVHGRMSGLLRQDTLTTGLPDAMTPTQYSNTVGVSLAGLTRHATIL